MQAEITAQMEERWPSEEEEKNRDEHMRQIIANLVGGKPSEIAFTRNTTQGLNIVANGIRWEPGQNIVTAHTEFPANVYPWMNLQRLGVEVRFTPVRDNRILPEDVMSMVDAQTRLVALSAVEFSTGYRNDLAAISKFCHQRGIYLSVDGIQSLGALPFDARAYNVDFVSAGAYKWLLGPVGVGFFWCREELIEELEITCVGLGSVVDSDDYFRYDSPLHTDARRFEEGSLNHVGLAGFQASVETLLEVGIPNIEKRLHDLTNYLIEGLHARGCEIVSPIDTWEERSGIVSFRSKNIPSEALHQKLADAGVIVSLRGGAIRVSPHFYNTEEEIERLLAELDHS